MADEDYKEQMRKYIEVVKKMAFEAPLEQALDDLKVMSQATALITDRVEMRVRKSLNPNDSSKKASVKSKASSKSKSIKPFPSVQPTQATQRTKPQSSLPTTNTPTSTATSIADINKVQQDYAQSLKPIQPIKPI